MMIVGGSGSGKSSLLRAGVLPRLKHPTEGRNWFVLPTLRYGELPSEEYTVFDQFARDLASMFPADAREPPDWKLLRDRFVGDDAEQAAKFFFDKTQDLTYARQCPDATVLLAIDQFEELLSPVAGPLADKFLRFLHATFRRRNGRLLVIGTMRSDYLEVYERHPHALIEPFFHSWRLGPFPRERIADVVKQPAARSHVEISDELLERLKHDTPTAEALPLLAFTLEKLYRHYAGDGKLELPEYVELGGMEGAIQKSVQRLLSLQSLSPDVLTSLRLSFVKRLAQVNEKDEIIRRTARWSELPLEVQPLLEQFVTERLLVKSDRDGQVHVEVAHEAMFRCWSELQEWLRTSGDILRWRRDVQRDQASDKHKWSGLRPAQLAVAREWLKHRHDELNIEEVRCIERGIFRERLRRGAVAAVMLLIAGLAGLFLWQKSEADQAAREANNNSTDANFALGRISFEKQDVEAAVLWWARACSTADDPGRLASLQNLTA